MEQKVVKKLEISAKTIKVSGQKNGPLDGKNCLYDCHIQEKELIGVYSVAYTGCLEYKYRVISDYYNASWSEAL